MSPAIAEIVFALGAGPRVVAVSQNTTYPPEALERPVCGGFFNPNYEAIVALRPDLIITQGIAVDMTGFARANGVELVTLDLRDLESIFSETLKLGRALQEEARAELLCAEMRYRLAQVRAGVSGRPPVRAMLVVGREPGTLNGIFAVGPGEFLNDLIYAAGGVNVFADLATPYAVVSKETVLERAPEVIVELQGEGGDPVERLQEARRLWGGLATLPAVRNGRVYVVEATYAMIPGPRVVVLAQRLAELLHEERQ
jgi:iron complex transport system substrate-binding protein